MPYKSEQIKIVNTEHDKRRKLTREQESLIRELYKTGEHSQRSLAAQFNVSRRLITFVIDPAKREANYKVRVQRGGSKQYYVKEQHTKYIREHRRYKQALAVEGKIK